MCKPVQSITREQIRGRGNDPSAGHSTVLGNDPDRGRAAAAAAAAEAATSLRS